MVLESVVKAVAANDARKTKSAKQWTTRSLGPIFFLVKTVTAITVSRRRFFFHFRITQSCGDRAVVIVFAVAA